MTRQQAYQIRQHAKGLCCLCPEIAVEGSWYCMRHMIVQRESRRITKNSRRRNYNAKSYGMQQAKRYPYRLVA